MLSSLNPRIVSVLSATARKRAAALRPRPRRTRRNRRPRKTAFYTTTDFPSGPAADVTAPPRPATRLVHLCGNEKTGLHLRIRHLRIPSCRKPEDTKYQRILTIRIRLRTPRENCDICETAGETRGYRKPEDTKYQRISPTDIRLRTPREL